MNRSRAIGAGTGTTVALVSWSLVGTGIALNDGMWTPVGLGCIVVGWLLLGYAVATRLPLTAPAAGATWLWALAVPAGLAAFAVVVWTPHWYASGRWLAVSHWAMRAAVAAALLGLLPRLRAHPAAFAVPLALAGLAGYAMVLAAPAPHIDVWYLLQQSTDGLVEGRNMYRQSWAGSTGLQAVYPYLPITSVLLLPFRLVLGDVRFGLVTASLLAAWLLRRTTGRTAPALLPLLVVLYPKWTFAGQQAWTEPLLVAGLAGMVLAARAGRTGVAVVAFAVALATKQHVALLLPLAAWWPAFGWRRAGHSTLLAATLVLPWVIAGPRDLWHDAVHANLALDVIPRALCIPSFLLRLGVEVPFAVPLLALGAAYVLVLLRLPRDAAGFCLGAALVLLTVDVVNKQSFFNHYTLPMALLVLAIVVAATERTAARQPSVDAVRAGIAS